MNTQLSHLDQYKMLREELMFHLQEISRIETWGAIAVASIYTWLFTHKQDIPSSCVWFVAPIVVLISAIRCLIHTQRINMIGRYLMRIEKIAFDQSSTLPGWECYLCERDNKSFKVTSIVASFILWTITFVILGSGTF